MRGEIVSITCPYCNDFKLFLSRDKYLDVRWQCLNCVYVFSYGWFNKFLQYENFVTRKVKNEF